MDGVIPGVPPASAVIELVPDALGLAVTRARAGVMRQARGRPAGAALVAFWVLVAAAMRNLGLRRRVEAGYRDRLPTRYTVRRV